MASAVRTIISTICRLNFGRRENFNLRFSGIGSSRLPERPAGQSAGSETGRQMTALSLGNTCSRLDCGYLPLCPTTLVRLFISDKTRSSDNLSITCMLIPGNKWLQCADVPLRNYSLIVGLYKSKNDVPHCETQLKVCRNLCEKQ